MKNPASGWSVSGLTVKLPLIDIHLKAPNVSSKSLGVETEHGILPYHSAGNRVFLKAFNGLFVCTELHKDKELMANRQKPQAWETFEVVMLADDKIALRACNGLYVTAEIYKRGELVATRCLIQGWETFTLRYLADGKISLQAFNGLYVGANLNTNGKLFADRPVARGWEAFAIAPAF